MHLVNFVVYTLMADGLLLWSNKESSWTLPLHRRLNSVNCLSSPQTEGTAGRCIPYFVSTTAPDLLSLNWSAQLSASVLQVLKLSLVQAPLIFLKDIFNCVKAII